MILVNVDALPAGQHLFTLAVGDVDGYDEVDWTGPARSSVADVVTGARTAGALDGYEDAPILGVIDQTDGYVLAESATGLQEDER